MKFGKLKQSLALDGDSAGSWPAFRYIVGMGGLPFRVLEGSALLLLAVLAGCGGRSSTLEDEALTGA